MTSVDCAKFAAANLEPRADIHEDCASAQVHVTSDSDVLMECVASVDLPSSDDLGRTHVEHRVLIGPGEERWLATAFGPASMAPYAFGTRCRVVPREPEAMLSTPDTCTAEVIVPVPDLAESYPRDAQAHGEEGRVIIEYTASAAPSKRIADVQVVGSSGYWRLDTHALGIAKSLRAISNCPGRRFRYTLQYRLSEAPPLPQGQVLN